jgi:hypothetical protein
MNGREQQGENCKNAHKQQHEPNWRPVAAPPSSVSLVPGRRQMQPGVEALQGYGCSSHTPRLLGVTSPGLAKEGKARAFSFFSKNWEEPQNFLGYVG